MRGLSEEDIKRFIRAHNIDEEHNWIAGALLEECHELDPWLPIDENTPKDRNMLLINAKNLSCYIGYFDSLIDVWCIQGATDFIPKHYKELPPDPTDGNSADT